MAYSQKIVKLLSNDFVRHNVTFLIGTLLISISNYLYYPVIGRLVSVASFGEIQALLSLFMQLGIVLTAFGYVVTNITNNADDDNESASLIVRLERITLLFCMLLFIVLSVSSVALKSSLQLTSSTPLLLTGILMLLNVPLTARTFFLQGQKKLKEVSITGIIFSLGKLILSSIFIYFIFSVTAAIMGYIVALVIALGYLFVKTKDAFPGLEESLGIKRKTLIITRYSLREELVYGLAILVLLSGTTLLYSSDTVIVRFFFDPVESGLYSAVSAVARIVFFVTASVSGVLLATVKMNERYAKNLQTLKFSFLITTLIGGVVSLFFVLFPEFSMHILFGGKYASSSDLLPLLSLVVLLCSYNNLLVCFEIALRRFKAIYIVLLGILIGCAAIYFRHDSLTDIVAAYLAANLLVFVLLSIQIVMRRKNV